MANAIPVTGRASIPKEASSNGGINETTPPEQRKPVSPTESNLSSGPQIGAKDEYLPASYKQEFVVAATVERPAVTHTLIRTDR